MVTELNHRRSSLRAAGCLRGGVLRGGGSRGEAALGRAEPEVPEVGLRPAEAAGQMQNKDEITQRSRAAQDSSISWHTLGHERQAARAQPMSFAQLEALVERRF